MSENASANSQMTIEEGVILAPFTSWLVGGPADHFALPRTVGDVETAVRWALARRLPITVLGGGTNVLVSDKGVRGLVICLRKLEGARAEIRATDGHVLSPHPAAPSADAPAGARLHLECLAGTSKTELLKILLKHKLRPALFVAGLPGDVGGGVVMNAGVGEMIQPREFVEITDWIEVLRWTVGAGGEPGRPAQAGASISAGAAARSGMVVGASAGQAGGAGPAGATNITIERVHLRADQLKWSYRHCEGWRPGIIVRAGLSCPYEPVPDVLAQVRQANLTRASKQPLDMPSCGSVFINPPGHKSGQLVEQAGLKGFAVGGAKVSEKHANFIVNFNQAKASDIHQVIEHARATVRARTGVELRTEVVYLGEW